MHGLFMQSVNFAKGILMHIKSCHDTFYQVDKLGTFELVNPNTRTERQCNAQLSQPSLPWLPGLKKSPVQE